MIEIENWESELDECGALFRADMAESSGEGFDRAGQLRLTAGVLSYLRDAHADLWNRVYETSGIRACNGPDHRGVREFKKLLGHLVRTADESKDHHRTVSYVSRSALLKIREVNGGKPKLGTLRLKNFAHEHGVPVDAVIRTIVYPKNRNVDLFEVLSAMACRTLILREQASNLDARFKASLTGHVKLGWGAYPVGALPLRYIALARYYAASPALLGELVPTSKRAATLLTEFKTLTEDVESVSSVELMMRDHNASRVAYIPDYVFDWART